MGVSVRRRRIKGRGKNSGSGSIVRLRSDWTYTGKFTHVDTVARWLIFRPEGSEFGGRPHGGARGELDKKEIKRTGVTIWFAKGWKKRGRSSVKLSEKFLKDGFGM